MNETILAEEGPYQLIYFVNERKYKIVYTRKTKVLRMSVRRMIAEIRPHPDWPGMVGVVSPDDPKVMSYITSDYTQSFHDFIRDVQQQERDRTTRTREFYDDMARREPDDFSDEK